MINQKFYITITPESSMNSIRGYCTGVNELDALKRLAHKFNLPVHNMIIKRTSLGGKTQTFDMYNKRWPIKPIAEATVTMTVEEF